MHSVKDWKGPHQGDLSRALTAAYTRYHTLTPTRILEIGRNVAGCIPQDVYMADYDPVQSLMYHVGHNERLMLVFPHRDDNDAHPVRIYTCGDMSDDRRGEVVAKIVTQFLNFLKELEGPGRERAKLVCVK